MSDKPSGDLKKFLDAKRPSSRLIGEIERHLMARPADARNYTVIHPSDMAKDTWCHREQYFLLTGAEKKSDKPNLRLQSIFDEGHAIHHKWQNWFTEMGAMYGNWACKSCHEVTRWEVSPNECSKCGSTLLEYAEVPLTDDDLRIAGRADGWIKGVGDDCLIEIKSVGAGTIRMEAPNLMAGGDLQEAWRGVRRPFRSHLIQGNIYLELLRRMNVAGIIDSYPEEIVFLYELKADQSYKEFSVKASYDLVKDKFEQAADIIAAFYAGEAPACNVSAKGCKSCSPYEEA
jgi:hypothetical protein